MMSERIFSSSQFINASRAASLRSMTDFCSSQSETATACLNADDDEVQAPGVEDFFLLPLGDGVSGNTRADEAADGGEHDGVALLAGQILA